MSDLLDVKEAAEYLRINEQTVRRLAREGAIPAFKVGGIWRFRKSALDQVESLSPEPVAADSGAPIRALVVDDDAGIRGFAVQALATAGIEATTAEDGRAALQLLGGPAPDVVLLDLMMPEVDGPTVLAEVRRSWGAVAVIIITAYPESELMARAMKHGPITLLSKPFNVTELVDCVQRAAGRREG